MFSVGAIDCKYKFKDLSGGTYVIGCIQDKRRRTLKYYLTKTAMQTMTMKNTSYRTQINPCLQNHYPKGKKDSLTDIFFFFAPLCVIATVDEEACAKQGSVQNIEHPPATFSTFS